MEDLWQTPLRGRERRSSLRLVRHDRFKVHFGGDVYDWEPERGRRVHRSPIVHREEEIKRLDRFAQFAMVAGIEAVNDSGLDFAKEDPHRCGVIIGSGIGGLHEIESSYQAA